MSTKYALASHNARATSRSSDGRMLIEAIARFVDLSNIVVVRLRTRSRGS